MEPQRGPDPDYISTGDIKTDHGWDEIDRQKIERDARKGRLPKPKRFSAVSQVQAFEFVCNKPYEGAESEWDAVMNDLELPLCYQPAVREALSQHRWRNAQNPVGYVKTVAMRIGLKSGVNIPDWHGKSPHEVCTVSGLGAVFWDKNELYRDSGNTRQDYIETLHYNSVPDYDPDEGYLDDRYWEFLHLGLIDRNREIDWRKIGRMAGLSREKARVLALKAQGLGRDAALETTRSETGRKKLQAAWRDLEPDRKGKTIIASVREVLAGRDGKTEPSRGREEKPSYVPPKQALETARERQIAPVVHETYESLNKKSYHLRWLQLSGK